MKYATWNMLKVSFIEVFSHVIYALREECPNEEFFWSVFSRILTKYRPEKLRIRTIFEQ